MMKRIFPILLCLPLIFSGCSTIQQIGQDILGTGSGSRPSNSDIIGGLKQALDVGIVNGANLLGKENGFFGNMAIKILFPPEAQKVESALRGIGLGSLADRAILLFNRAAEDAAKSAAPIFKDAITKMTFNDAMNILMGENNAATNYLKSSTYSPLEAAFSPVVDNSIGRVKADVAWNEVTTRYNKIPFVEPVNPNLTGYITEKALNGLFHMVEKEEAKIRTKVDARVTDLLQRVFGWAAENRNSN